ncbi:hypothetical protein ICY20_11525 [Pseudomonas sp. P115]|uniref:hypothetical protein n=1 Tax=Pseudomonas pisciculturae TaxID=2730413 RepID=UPI0018924696|nr:hypothetical protein [Pseudomonas pisciculturae]MBF6028373.1 hypothetical protein [Pseudomonas pisciculturae]
MTALPHFIPSIALFLLPLLAQAEPVSPAVEGSFIEVVNKTKTPLDIVQGKWTTVVLPGASLRVEDTKNPPLTIATKTRGAAIRFVTLSHARGCKAQTCLLITGE